MCNNNEERELRREMQEERSEPQTGELSEKEIMKKTTKHNDKKKGIMMDERQMKSWLSENISKEYKLMTEENIMDLIFDPTTSTTTRACDESPW